MSTNETRAAAPDHVYAPREGTGLNVCAVPGCKATIAEHSPAALAGDAMKPSAAPVDQERIDAALARITRAVEYLDTIAADSPYDKFADQRLSLRQALDLLNPEVKLA